MRRGDLRFWMMAVFTILVFMSYNSLFDSEIIPKNAEREEFEDAVLFSKPTLENPESKEESVKVLTDLEPKKLELKEPVLVTPVASSEKPELGMNIKETQFTQPQTEETEKKVVPNMSSGETETKLMEIMKLRMDERKEVVPNMSSGKSETKFMELMKLGMDERKEVVPNMSPGETETKFMERMKLRMDERKARVREYCDKLGLQHNWRKIRDFMLASSEYKTVMCQIPKTGITNWKRLFSDLKGIRFNEALFFNKYQISGEEKRSRLTDPDWLKMTVVREPMERLISAYRSKLHGTRLAMEIQALFGDKNDPDYEKRKSPTFSTFVEFLLKANSSLGSRRDQHWAKFSDLCHFCDFEYDIIGLQETVKEDSEYFLRLVGAPRSFFLQSGYSTRTDPEMAYRYYSTVKPRERVMELYKMLEDDYFLFGYPRPQWFSRLFDEKQNSASFA